MIETNFKHTDIGLIPHDWEVKELEPLCSKLCVGFVGTCEPYYVSAGIFSSIITNLTDSANGYDDNA